MKKTQTDGVKRPHPAELLALCLNQFGYAVIAVERDRTSHYRKGATMRDLWGAWFDELYEVVGPVSRWHWIRQCDAANKI